MREINQTGLSLIQSFEALKLTPYDDGAGCLTIGWGHLIKRGERFTKITQGQADRLLQGDLVIAETAVASFVKVALNDNQYAALVSYCFNRGNGNFQKSDVLRLVNQGKFAEAATAIANFIAQNPNVRRGVTRRRKAEAELFLKG